MAAKQLDGHPGDRIGDLRTNLGMTKKELSQKTGIDASQITRIENGSLKTISSDYLIKLAKELKTSTDYILGLTPVSVPKSYDISELGLSNEAVKGLVTGTIDVGILEMSRNVQSGNTQNLKSMVIQRSFPKWSVAERRKTAAASNQAAVCACAHSRYFTGGSPSGLRV